MAFASVDLIPCLFDYCFSHVVGLAEITAITLAIFTVWFVLKRLSVALSAYFLRLIVEKPGCMYRCLRRRWRWGFSYRLAHSLPQIPFLISLDSAPHRSIIRTLPGTSSPLSRHHREICDSAKEHSRRHLDWTTMDAMGQMGFCDCGGDFRSIVDDQEVLSQEIDDGAVYERRCKRDIIRNLPRTTNLAWRCYSYTLRTRPGAARAGGLPITSVESEHPISEIKCIIGDETTHLIFRC